MAWKYKIKSGEHEEFWWKNLLRRPTDIEHLWRWTVSVFTQDVAL
jgi:hypothetical protein